MKRREFPTLSPHRAAPRRGRGAQARLFFHFCRGCSTCEKRRPGGGAYALYRVFLFPCGSCLRACAIPFSRARRRGLSLSFPAPCHRVRPAFCCPFSRGGRGGGGCRCPHPLASVKGRRFAPCERRGEKPPLFGQGKEGGAHRPYSALFPPTKKPGEARNGPPGPVFPPLELFVRLCPLPLFSLSIPTVREKRSVAAAPRPRRPKSAFPL